MGPCPVPTSVEQLLHAQPAVTSPRARGSCHCRAGQESVELASVVSAGAILRRDLFVFVLCKIYLIGKVTKISFI